MNGKRSKKLRREAIEIMGHINTSYHRMPDGSIRSMSVKAFAKFLDKIRKENA